MNKYKLFAPGFEVGFRPAFFLVFGASLLAALWRFLPWMPSVFYGDDLDYLLLFKDGQCATRAAEILTTTCYERFRPVASAFVIGMMNLFGNHLEYYLAVNVAIQSAIGVLVFAISERLSRGNWVVSLLIALAIVTSRFATYQVTQMIGPVESLTLALCLGAVYSTIRADENPARAWRWCWLALSFSFLAMHTHERSMVIALWLALAFVISPSIRSLSWPRWLGLIAISLALPVYYIAFKTFVLKAYFLVGTGGTHIDLGLPQIFEHATEALPSVLGFNRGPEYLVGASVSRAWPVACALAAVFALAWLSLLAAGIRSAAAKQLDTPEHALVRLRWPLLLLALAAALLAPSLLTVRLEQRWLLAPFVVGLLATAWASGMPFWNARLRTILVAMLCISSISLDSLIARHYDRLFFISSPRFAEQVKQDIVEGYPHQQGGVALMAGADQCGWTLRNGGFFRIYGGKQRAVRCFASVEEAANAGLSADTRIYQADAEHRFRDISPRSGPGAESPDGPKIYDFLAQFSVGQINDPRQVASPTGRGVILRPWETAQGARNTITVISGFSYRFDDIMIPDGAQLRFSAGMIYASPQSARAVIRIAEVGKETVVAWSKDLVPPGADGVPQFLPVSLSLATYAGKRITVSFSAESPGGNSSGHWIGYAEPRISMQDPLLR